MKKLTVFANFLIDDEERFLRMKDSFKSFEKAKINGPFKDEFVKK